MIYTLTFNPALDYIIKVPEYKEGVVNRTSEEKFLPGGKGINVSTVLTNLGIKNIALGFIAGFTGNIIENMLTSLNVGYDFIHIDNNFSRINVKIKAHKETEINGQGPIIDEAAMKELYNKLECMNDGDFLVLAGSVPKTLSDSIYCDIMEHLKEKDINISFTYKKMVFIFIMFIYDNCNDYFECTKIYI